MQPHIDLVLASHIFSIFIPIQQLYGNILLEITINELTLNGKLCKQAIASTTLLTLYLS